MPILFQISTEKPLAGSSASSMISQAKSVRLLDLANGGFAVFCTAANWAKMQTVMQTVKTEVKRFSI